MLKTFLSVVIIYSVGFCDLSAATCNKLSVEPRRFTEFEMREILGVARADAR